MRDVVDFKKIAVFWCSLFYGVQGHEKLNISTSGGKFDKL